MSMINALMKSKEYLLNYWQQFMEEGKSGVPLTYKVKEQHRLQDYDFPSFSELFPYRYFDSESKIFINQFNAGVIYQVIPLTGANENVAEQLDDILRNKISDEFTLQVIYVKHKLVGHFIDRFANQFNGSDFVSLGHIGEKLKDYYQQAAREGFQTRNNAEPSLKHTECFIIIDCVKKTSEEELKVKLNHFQLGFEAALSASQIGHKLCDVADFLYLTHFFLKNNLKSIYPPDIDYQPESPLHHQITDMGFDCELKKDHLLLSGYNKGQPFQTALSVLTLSQLPSQLCLWENIDNNSNIFQEKTLSCDHIISVIYQVEKQPNALTKANRKTRDFDKKAKSQYAINVAGTEEQARNWRAFREELAQHKTKAVKMLYNVLLFSDPNEIAIDVENASRVFSYNKMKLSLAKNQQLPYFLISMPFLFTNNLEKDFSLPRMMWPISSWNATQYMPLLSDWQGLSEGILLPSLRDQFCLLNPFDDYLGTNYNMAITGTSGGGKSFAVQMMILNVLFQGGDVFVIDIGASYKKLCHVLGGVYLEYENLALNPFTHVSNIFNDITGLVDLFELLACPRTEATDDDRGTLRAAIMYAFENHGNIATIDAVCDRLQSLYLEENETYPTAKILAKNLQCYCQGAEHGAIFNRPSSLSPDARFIVIDLQSIENNSAIRAPVLLSAISQIQHRIFNSDRSRKKMCIIDEAWKFFTNNPIATSFIVNGFRTGRKYMASFVMITQGVSDFYKFQEARAVWDNAALKLIFLQDIDSLNKHNKEHETFSPLEVKILEKFPKAKDAGYSHVLVKTGKSYSFHRLFVDPFTRVLLSSDGKDYTQVERYVAEGMSFLEAVEKVALNTSKASYV